MIEDGVEVGVTEVRVDLSVILDSGGRESERVDGPGEVGVPVDISKGETLIDSLATARGEGRGRRRTLSNGGLVDLNGEELGGLEVDDLISESERELLALSLSGDVDSREGPVEAVASHLSVTIPGKRGKRTNMVTGPVNIAFIGSEVSD